MSKLSGIFEILKVKPTVFFDILEDERRYRIFKINKKGGGQRELLAPRQELCFLQKKFLNKLVMAYQPTRAAHGFTIGKSILTNANLHVSKHWVLNVDIKNFFPSISDRRVYGALYNWSQFRKQWDLTKKEIYFLAQLCCFEQKLPQGAPTSPFLSNLVARKLDKQMLEFSYKNKLCYTRYCDDITLSPMHPRIDYDCLLHQKSGKLKEEFISIFIENGFQLNSKKTRLQTQPRPLRVTGLVVNRTVNIQRKWIRQVRAMLADLETLAPATVQEKYYEECGKRGGAVSIFRVLWGKIQFISMIRGKGDPIYLKLRKRFLVFCPFEATTLKVELDDFPKRQDISSIIHEDNKFENSNGKITSSYLSSWVKIRIDYLIGGSHSLRKYYLDGVYENVYIAEKAFLLSHLKLGSSQREIFTHFKTAWDRLVSCIGDEYGKRFSELPEELLNENRDLKRSLKEFWCQQEIPFDLKGEKGTFRSIYRGSANEGLRGQGMAALILFVALGLLQGKHPSIAKQIKRVNKAYEIDPLFGQHFYKLRDIRNTDKRRDPNFENFREGFYRALKTFGTKLR